jgi:hypothetical protein
MPKEFVAVSDLDSDVDDFDYDTDENGELLTYEDYVAMGIDPIRPTRARPGSEEKVLMLSARYAAGVPLWHNDDCYDHGPGEIELMGSQLAVRTQVQTQIDLDD